MEKVPERLPFVFASHTGSPTGYSETAVVMMRGFIEGGLEVHYRCVHDDYIYEAPSYELVVNAYRAMEPENEPVEVVYSIAPMFLGNGAKYRVGWSMIEVDQVCERWARACNRMQEVWVPTQMNKESFVAGGVEVPVRVVPLGIDVRAFSPSFLPMIYHGDHRFRFFAAGFWQLRKRWDLLVRAFHDEFGKDKDVGLVIKTMCEGAVENIVTQIQSWIGHDCDDQIAVIEGGLPWWEYVGIMRACQAFVLPTAGEGFGCPPVQALACGLPVIVTNCMGPGEVLRDRGGAAFPGVRFLSATLEKCTVEHEYYRDGRWWVADVGEIRGAMREVYENWERWREAALAGSEAVRARFSGQACAEAVKAELTRIYRDCL